MISKSPAARIALSLTLLATPLSACAPTEMLGGRAARIGPDDGTDSCHQYVVALDSTGNFFAGDIMASAAAGAVGGGLIGGLATGRWKDALIGAGVGAATGAAVGYWNALRQQHYDQAVLYSHVQSDIGNDNAQIGRTQFAFDQLMGCRFQQAAGINEAVRAGRTDRTTAQAQMQSVRALAQRDIAFARSIDARIEQRGQQFAVAADNITQGAATAYAPPPAEAETLTLRPTTLLMSPNPGAPQVASLPERAKIQVQRRRGNYALVQSDTGQTGYAPIEDVKPAKPTRSLHSKPTPAAAATPPQQNIATLAGSNAARRDDFAQSVAVSDKTVATSFEVAG